MGSDSIAVVLTAVTMALAVVGVGPGLRSLPAETRSVSRAVNSTAGRSVFFPIATMAASKSVSSLRRDRAGKVEGAFDACQRCWQCRKG
jgi:hypothetical protein